MNDQKTTIGELKSRIARFQKERHWNPHAKNLAVSIAIEAAELLEHYQWDDYEEYQKREDAKKKEIENELADVVIYCLEFALKNGTDVAQAIERKLGLAEKKYPARLFRGKRASDHYYKIKSAYRAKKTA